LNKKKIFYFEKKARTFVKIISRESDPFFISECDIFFNINHPFCSIFFEGSTSSIG